MQAGRQRCGACTANICCVLALPTTSTLRAWFMQADRHMLDATPLAAWTHLLPWLWQSYMYTGIPSSEARFVRTAQGIVGNSANQWMPLADKHSDSKACVHTHTRDLTGLTGYVAGCVIGQPMMEHQAVSAGAVAGHNRCGV